MNKRISLRVTLLILALSFIISPLRLPTAQPDEIFIRSDGSIDPPTAPIQRNGNVYTLTSNIYSKTIVIQKDYIVIDGNDYTIQGSGIHLSKGIDLLDREGVTIKNINIGDFYYGISLNSSEHNTVFGNTVFETTYVIYASESQQNKIYNNNFVSEPSRIYHGINIWDNDYPSGGNYWSDYENEDFSSGPYQDVAGSDGIGDWILRIDEDNMDNYPLMGMYSIFNVMTQEGTQHVYIISNSAISSFTYSSTDHTISFDANGNAETLGFCRICIPHALIQEPYVTVNAQTPIYANYNLYDNDTHRWTYFSYEHLKHVIIVPARLLTDLNNDGTVNILDITIVATAFGTKPGDERWNETADLDKNGVINILDVAMIASDYGKTVE